MNDNPGIMSMEADREMLGNRRKNDPIIRQLEAVLPHLKKRFGVARIGCFGSVVRGEDRPESDIDLLVEFAPGEATFRNFMELVYYLEDLLGRKVDLVTDQGLSKYLRRTVEKEVIWCGEGGCLVWRRRLSGVERGIKQRRRKERRSEEISDPADICRHPHSRFQSFIP